LIMRYFRCFIFVDSLVVLISCFCSWIFQILCFDSFSCFSRVQRYLVVLLLRTLIVTLVCLRRVVLISYHVFMFSLNLTAIVPSLCPIGLNNISINFRFL
jgi:hypothetical protein